MTESKPNSPAPPVDATKQRRHSYFVGGGVEVEKRLPGGSLFGDEQGSHVSRDAFVVIQGFILKTLQNYWVPRFVIHCKIRCYHRDGSGNVLMSSASINVHDINTFSPNWYAVKVRSLSELLGQQAGEVGADIGSDEIGRSAHVLGGMQGVCKKLQKQSMSNLMAMFSSRGLRNSELNAMLKMEDTGERLGERTSGDSYDDGWLIEEFPLATISEESIAAISRQSSATAKSSSRSSLSISPRSKSPKSPEHRAKKASSRHTHSGGKVRPSRSKIRPSKTRVMSPLARVPCE